MEIHKFHFNRGVDLAQEQIRLAERAVGGRHVGAALQIEDGALHSVAGLHGDQSMTRRLRIVRRPQQARLAVQVIVEFPLVPDMVAAGENIEAEGEEVLGNRGSDAEAPGGVLRVGNRQIDPIRFDDILHVVRHNTPPGRAKNIADKENSHRAFTLTRWTKTRQAGKPVLPSI